MPHHMLPAVAVQRRLQLWFQMLQNLKKNRLGHNYFEFRRVQHSEVANFIFLAGGHLVSTGTTITHWVS